MLRYFLGVTFTLLPLRAFLSPMYILKAWPTLIELASVYKRLREFEYKIEQDELIDEKI